MNSYYKELLEALELGNKSGNIAHEESAFLCLLADYNALKIISDMKSFNGENNEKCIFLLNEIADEISKQINDYIDRVYDLAKNGTTGDY